MTDIKDLITEQLDGDDNLISIEVSEPRWGGERKFTIVDRHDRDRAHIKDHMAGFALCPDGAFAMGIALIRLSLAMRKRIEDE